MNSFKIYLLPYVIAIGMIVYGLITDTVKGVVMGLSVIAFTTPALIGSLYTLKKNNDKIEKRTYRHANILLWFSVLIAFIGNSWSKTPLIAVVMSLTFGLVALYLIYRDLKKVENE